jgi:probable F420-dependent oxidoreductase
VSARGFDAHHPDWCREVIAEVEDLGYGTIWVPEGLGREIFTNCAVLLGGTRRMTVASAVANVWSRGAWATNAASKTLGAAFGDRFVLGLGIGHQPLVEQMGLDYHGPLHAMRTYLDRLDAAPFRATGPDREPMRLLAAMGPKMMSLAAERCDGALPNCATAQQTRDARTILGDKFLAPTQKVVLATDPTVARAAAREALWPYWSLPNYLRQLRHSGWSEEDLADGGSDRLVAWGDVDAIAARVKEHFDAGADHLVLHVQAVGDGSLPLAEWRTLGPALLGG